MVVKFGTVTDALGRKRECWMILDGKQVRGTFDSEDQATRNMQAIQQISFASR